MGHGGPGRLEVDYGFDAFPLSMALEDVGDRWTLHVVYALLEGPQRYADLKAFLAGAGSNVLGDRLRR